MYSCEQDHTAAARATFTNTSYQPCAAPRSLELAAAAHQPGKQVVLPVPAAAAAAAVQPRRARNKKHGASSRPSPSSSSRRSSTTVVATDVNNFRAMVQELTGFPPAAIFRPLPRRVHAASPSFVGGDAAQGCSGSERHGRYSGSEATNSTACGGGGGSSSPDAPAAPPVMAQPPQCAALGVFDGLPDLGSPEFDCWGDLSIE